jgi:hypothetical protein
MNGLMGCSGQHSEREKCYDEEVAQLVGEEISRACDRFGVSREEVDRVLLNLREVGSGGIKTADFKRKYEMGQRLSACFDEFARTLGQRMGGVCVIPGVSPRIVLEKRGIIYLEQHFPETLEVARQGETR